LYFFINSDIKCSVTLISEEDKKISILLDVPIVIQEGLEIFIKNDKSNIAKAIITE
jgi:hypothetical protein